MVTMNNNVIVTRMIAIEDGDEKEDERENKKKLSLDLNWNLGYGFNSVDSKI